MKICGKCGRTYPDEAGHCAKDGTALTEAASTGGLVGQILDGRYEIQAPLGAGGLGEVYRARHVKMGKSFAVKVLHNALASDPAFIARFDREARALSKLEHPYLVAAIDYGTSTQGPYIVMDLVEGTALSHYTRGQGMPLGEALQIVGEMLSGLEHAHGQGIVHRDLKPDNVMLVKDPLTKGKRHPKILDFGIAKLRAGALQTGQASTLTQLGTLVGTPAYLAPEQAAGAVVDERADVYATGIMLYELVCGRRPFEHADKLELIRAQLLTPPPPPKDARPDVPDALVKVMLKALTKKPSERWQTAEQFREALAKITLPAKLAAQRPPLKAGVPATDDASDTTSVDEISAVEPELEPSAPGPKTREPRSTVRGKPAERAPQKPPVPRRPSPPATPAKGGGGAGRTALALVGLAILGAVGVGAWMLGTGAGAGDTGDTAGRTDRGNGPRVPAGAPDPRATGAATNRPRPATSAPGSARTTAAVTGAPVATARPATAGPGTGGAGAAWAPAEELAAAEASFRKRASGAAATRMSKYLFAHPDDVEGRLFAARAFLSQVWIADGFKLIEQAIARSPGLALDDDTLVALGHAFRGDSLWKALSMMKKHGGDRVPRALLVAAVVVPYVDMRAPLLRELKKAGVPATPGAAELFALAATSDCAKRNDSLERAGAHAGDPAVALALRWLRSNKCLGATAARLAAP